MRWASTFATSWAARDCRRPFFSPWRSVYAFSIRSRSNLRLKAFDLLQQTQTASAANADTVIIDIDEQSLSRLGR